MSMMEYIMAIKRGLRDVYGMKPTGGTEREPLFANVPDGEYPMKIEGKIDNVRIIGGKINCCNWG